MKPAFSPHAIHLCFCFPLAFRNMHIGPDPQHQLNPIITTAFLHKLASICCWLWIRKSCRWLIPNLTKIATILYPYKGDFYLFLILMRYSLKFDCTDLVVCAFRWHSHMFVSPCRMKIHVYPRSQCAEGTLGTADAWYEPHLISLQVFHDTEHNLLSRRWHSLSLSLSLSLSSHALTHTCVSSHTHAYKRNQHNKWL